MSNAASENVSSRHGHIGSEGSQLPRAIIVAPAEYTRPRALCDHRNLFVSPVLRARPRLRLPRSHEALVRRL